MAKDEMRRIPPTTLSADQQSFQALQAITGYAPANGDYSLANLKSNLKAMQDTQAAETQALAAANAARDAATAAEWDFHNLMLGVKTQIYAQYGSDSNEVQALGLKKKSEYKRPSRRASKPPDTTG